jgi:hypothetical protein
MIFLAGWCAENVVAWCRLRDRMMAQEQKPLEMVLSITTMSVVGSLRAGGMAVGQWASGAPRSPYYLSCLWYATVGGIMSIVQLLSTTVVTGAIQKQQGMLQEQLECVNQEAAVASKDDPHPEFGLSFQLRSASAAIRSELDTYNETPHRRFIYILGLPVGAVLKPMITIVASQGGVYFWHYLQDLADVADGSVAGTANENMWT